MLAAEINNELKAACRLQWAAGVELRTWLLILVHVAGER